MDGFDIAAGEGHPSFLLAPILRPKGDSRGVSNTLVSVAGGDSAQGARIIQNEWSMYQGFRYQGSPGGPVGPGDAFVPLAKVIDGHVEVPGPQYSYLPVDIAPPSLPPEKARHQGHDLIIVGANARFFVTALSHPHPP